MIHLFVYIPSVGASFSLFHYSVVALPYAPCPLDPDYQTRQFFLFRDSNVITIVDLKSQTQYDVTDIIKSENNHIILSGKCAFKYITKEVSEKYYFLFDGKKHFLSSIKICEFGPELAQKINSEDKLTYFYDINGHFYAIRLTMSRYRRLSEGQSKALPELLAAE